MFKTTVTTSSKKWSKAVSKIDTINALLTSRAKIISKEVEISADEVYKTGGITLGLKGRLKKILIALPNKEIFVHNTNEAHMLNYDAETDKLKLEKLYSAAIGADKTFHVAEVANGATVAVKLNFTMLIIGV